MNMKKSIAAVSAGAMAISAMATVASANVVYHPTNENATSAREQIVLTYDLATYVRRNKPTSIKITTTYEGAEYLIKGLDIDVRNGGTTGSKKGYTVLLGDRLVEAENKKKTYFIQTVELQAWSMDHHNPSIYNDGINGIRNRSKIWYSRASFGKDITDMQNEAAAVEDHDHIKVIGTDNDQRSEYAFQVEFNTLENSTSGDFILNDFKASEQYNNKTGLVAGSYPSYTLYDAVTVKDTIFKGTPATGLTVKSLEGAKIPYIDSKLEAIDYEIVAAVDGVNEATQGSVFFRVKSPVIDTTGVEKKDGVTDADILAALNDALSPYFRKYNGQALSFDDFNSADKYWYWDGYKFVDDSQGAAAVKLQRDDDKYVGVIGADANENNIIDSYELGNLTAVALQDDANAGAKDTDAITQDNYVKNSIAEGGQADNAIRSFLADTSNKYWTATAKPDLDAGEYDNVYLFQGGDVATPKGYKFYVVKKGTAKTLDTRFNQDAQTGYSDDLNNKILAYDEASIKAATHYMGTDDQTDWVYSFNKFVVTSTFTVNWDDWDNVNNYTGSGSNAKFTPIHNGIGRDRTIKDTASYGGQEAFYGTSSVNYSGNAAYFVVKPMKSSLNKPADVIKSLEAMKDGEKHYTSPVTVLNDVIANNEEVSFEFVSCSKHVRNVNDLKVERARKTPYVDKADTTSPLYTASIWNPTTNELETRMISGKYIKGVALTDYFLEGYTTEFDWFNGAVSAHNGGQESIEWYNPVFGQHLYGNPTYQTDNNHTLSTNGTGYPLTGPTTDGADQTGVSAWVNWAPTAIGNYGSYNYGGWNTNLFNGGLVINSNWTMQINDTKHFDWGNNSIIFFWTDLTAEVKTHATNFLVSMQLYTPNDWYWDTLNVGVGASAAENVFQGATGEGLDNDAEEVLEEEEIVEEEPIEEEEYFEDFEEEEPEEEYYEEEFEDFEDYEEEEEEYEEEPEEVEVEVKEVPSPKTGNSPIALAVIPVALAAAAIVAKKKND
jgi:hypothetical protein